MTNIFSILHITFLILLNKLKEPYPDDFHNKKIKKILIETFFKITDKNKLHSLLSNELGVIVEYLTAISVNFENLTIYQPYSESFTLQDNFFLDIINSILLILEQLQKKEEILSANDLNSYDEFINNYVFDHIISKPMRWEYFEKKEKNTLILIRQT